MKKGALEFIICVCIVTALTVALIIIILSASGAITFGKPEPISQIKIDEQTLRALEEKEAEKAADEKAAAVPAHSTEKPETVYEQELPKTIKGIVVLDAGHGISSGIMTDSEKATNGWIYNSANGGWGEWRHWKSGTVWQDCMGSGCSGRAPQGGGCWYPIGSGDRDTEPELNMNNALAAKKYLEQMGYEVRLTRGTTDNPSMTKRLEYCYPNGDITMPPDADIFVCLHSNAGGGRGSYYIALSGLYDQAGIDDSYITNGNALGKCINDRIVQTTGLSAASGGRYNDYPELVLFCKSPITIAYMEIGFFDNASDLEILQNNSDAIGKAIADGINDYMTTQI